MGHLPGVGPMTDALLYVLVGFVLGMVVFDPLR